MRYFAVMVLVCVQPLVAQVPEGSRVVGSHEDIRHLASLVAAQRSTVEGDAPQLGWGETSEARYKEIVGSLVTLLEAARWKNVPEHGLRALGPRVRDFNDAVDAIYQYEPPSAILDLRNSADGLFRGAAAQEIDEYERRFFIRYGSRSQRLNLLEIALDNLVAGTAVGSGVRFPPVIEPVARIKATSFQYDRSLGDLDTAYPIAMVGATFYLFGEDRVSNFLNHVGLTAAGLRDWNRGAWYVGPMVHVRKMHLGYLLNPGGELEPRIAASFNVQLIRGLF